MGKNIVIIGGGYGGLASANLLAKAGHKVTVIEKRHQLGGRAGQLWQDGFRFDTGPSWYLMPEAFEDYYRLFDIDVNEELNLTRLKPGYKVFFETSKDMTIQGDLELDSQTFESIEPGAASRLKKYVNESQRIYDISLNHILYSNYTRPWQLVNKHTIGALPSLLKLITRSLDSHVTKNFKDPRLTRILEYHSVFLGSSPYEVPAIYSLMSSLDFKSGVYFPKNGMYGLVESMVKLGQSLGVNYLPNTPVTKITSSNGQAAGVTLEDGSHVPADIVISNADINFTETHLLEEQDRSLDEKYWQKRQPGPSAMLISLGIKGSFTNLEHHNLYFVDDWRENFESIYGSLSIPDNASIYICNPSKTDPTAAPEGYENIFILLPLPANLEVDKETEQSLADRCISLLEKITNHTDVKDRIITRDIVRPQDFYDRFGAWQNNALGGESHLLTQSVFFRTNNVSKKIKNLYYVGAGTNPGIGLPMCLISAQLVFKRIHNIHTSTPLKKEDICN